MPLVSVSSTFSTETNFVGPCPQLGGPGNGITWLQGVQVSKVIPYTPVVACNTNIPIPDAGAGEVTGPFGQGSAVRSFIDPDRQANGRDLERPQVSAGVVEIACDGGKRWAAPVAAAVHSRISDAPCLRYQAAALQRTGNQVGGQGCAGAGEIAGWAPKPGGIRAVFLLRSTLGSSHS